MNLHNSIFTQKRPIYLELGGAESASVASGADKMPASLDTDISKAKEVGMEALEKNMTPTQAINVAKSAVWQAGRNAINSLARDRELIKNVKEFKKYQKRIDEAVNKAITEIDGNMEKYKSIAAFRAVENETWANYRVFRDSFDKAKGTNNLLNLPNLYKSLAYAQRLENSLKAIPKIPELVDKRTKLSEDIDEDLVDIAKEIISIRDFHKKQLEESTKALAEVYNTLSNPRKTERGDKNFQNAVYIRKPMDNNPAVDSGNDVNKNAEAEKRPAVEFSDSAARDAWQNIFYIKQTRAALAVVQPGWDLDKVAVEATEQAVKVMPLLKRWHQTTFNKKEKNDQRAEMAMKTDLNQLAVYEKNLAKAEALRKKIENKPNPSPKEINLANSWVNGARAAVDGQLLALSANIYNQQTNHKDFGEEAPPPILLALRNQPAEETGTRNN